MENNFKNNKNLNKQETAEKKTKLDSAVTSLVVTLTTACDIRCIMCEEYSIPWDMPEKTIKEIIGLMPYLESIIWQGGEVLILDYFPDLVKEASRHPNLHQSIITNGLSITEELADKLVNENVELTFSIDGADKKSYEAIRRGSSFEKLVCNIKMVQELRKKKNLKNMTIRMHTVIMGSNYTLLEQFVDFAATYGFDALHMMPIWGNLDSEENIFHKRNEKALEFISKNLVFVKEKAKNMGINLLSSLPSYEAEAKDKRAKEQINCLAEERQPKEMLCHMPWKRMVINPAGNVCPACHCNIMVGNVLKQNLSEIWNNEAMVLYRKNIIEHKYQGFCSEACVKGIIAKELRGLE